MVYTVLLFVSSYNIIPGKSYLVEQDVPGICCTVSYRCLALEVIIRVAALLYLHISMAEV